jgi:hypothetical protein
LGQVVESITPDLKGFIEAQPLFFVASAPLAASGHVNLSPKGLDSFRVLTPNRVAYRDLTGSGNETSAHLTENGRITFMFCAFAGPPRILRLYGRGTVVLPDALEWPALAALFQTLPGTRQIIVADIHRVQTSCGFGVPVMDVVEQRETLLRWAVAKGEQITKYRQQKNATSIDGLSAPFPQDHEGSSRPSGG